MTVMLVLLNPNKPLLSKEKVSEEEKLNSLIRRKIEKCLQDMSPSQLNRKDGQIAYEIFMAINTDRAISNLLPPGALLSGKSTLIKDIIKTKLSQARS